MKKLKFIYSIWLKRLDIWLKQEHKIITPTGKVFYNALVVFGKAIFIVFKSFDDLLMWDIDHFGIIYLLCFAVILFIGGIPIDSWKYPVFLIAILAITMTGHTKGFRSAQKIITKNHEMFFDCLPKGMLEHIQGQIGNFSKMPFSVQPVKKKSKEEAN